MRPVTVTRVVHCDVPIDDVWKLVSDTLRLNRAAGMSPLDVTPNDSRGLDRYTLRCRLGGFDVTYLERPFTWQHNKFFSFYREFLDGPATSLATRYELAAGADEASCDVTVHIDIVPRWRFVRPVVWFATKRTMAAVVEFLGTAAATPKPVTTLKVDPNALQIARSRIGSRHARELVSRLADHVSAADDFDVAPMRPFALAARWGVDRTALLRLCLEAVRAGMLELRWGIICPSCNLASQVLPSLNELDGKGHCHACDIRFDTDLDRAVEAQFFPHPSVRGVELRPYCIGGPALTPHVLAQIALEADAEGSIQAPTELARVRLFVRGGAVAVVDIDEGAPTSTTVVVHPDEIAPSYLPIAPGGTIQVRNQSGEGRHVKIERTEWLSGSATAHHVAAIPEFRSLFGAEALRPGLALKVSNVAIVFCDLCGSTALYSQIGDAQAFGIVNDCFAHWLEIIERGGGTVVKTMGDAVMAAFVDTGAAVSSGVEMLKRWPTFVEGHPGAKALDLKIGINAGPCTVVTANGAIDYFGQTVNGAARVLHLARAREAVIAESLVERLPLHQLEPIERFQALVKGIDAPLRLARVRAHSIASGQAAAVAATHVNLH